MVRQEPPAYIQVCRSNALLAADFAVLPYILLLFNINVKPKPQEEIKGWVCDICGYVYEGEDLPEDFICPLCKHPASDFSRIGF